MRKGTKRSPIQPKSKEQIAREMEIKRKRVIVVDKFFPALAKATISIDEARMFVSATTSFIMEAVMDTMRQRKFSEISERVLKGLSPDGERKEEISALLDIFSGETLFVSREIIEGAKQAIDQAINDEMRERKLNDIKFNWDKYLNS